VPIQGGVQIVSHIDRQQHHDGHRDEVDEGRRQKHRAQARPANQIVETVERLSSNQRRPANIVATADL
jgi:hypothetical protein